MPVEWTTSALADLAAIAGFIAQDDPEAAKRVAQRIHDVASTLAAHPGLGRPGRVQDTRELVVPGLPYILPYQVKGATPFILRVLHTARKWPDGFQR